MTTAQLRRSAGRPDGGQFSARSRIESDVQLLPTPYPFTEPTVPLDPNEPRYSKPRRQPGQECLNSGRALTHSQWSKAQQRPSDRPGYRQATVDCWRCGATAVLIEWKQAKHYNGVFWNYTRHAVPLEALAHAG